MPHNLNRKIAWFQHPAAAPLSAKHSKARWLGHPQQGFLLFGRRSRVGRASQTVLLKDITLNLSKAQVSHETLSYQRNKGSNLTFCFFLVWGLRVSSGSVWVQVHMHTRVEHRAQPQLSFFLRSYQPCCMVCLEHTNCTCQSENTRDLIVSAHPVLGSQVHSNMPRIFTWALGINVRSSCLPSKHLTH